jgi:hypothetical protein
MCFSHNWAIFLTALILARQLLLGEGTDLPHAINGPDVAHDIVLRVGGDQVIQRALDALHHGVGLAGRAAVLGDVAGVQVLAEVDAAGLQGREQRVERVDLLRHRVPAVVHDDVEVAARLGDEALQERDVGLVAREDRRARGARGPLRGTLCVVLDVVQVDVREVFEPGVVRRSRPIAHVAAKANLQHLHRSVSERLEVLVIHVMVAVRRNLVGSMLACNVEEGCSVFPDANCQSPEGSKRVRDWSTLVVLVLLVERVLVE